MAARSGRALEDLVAGIERVLLGEGFSVETRVREYDDAGNQTAEIDVQAKGEIGSSSLHWVFECRDRPSDGPAGVSWIEQLVARRDRLKADKVFAVSTTGFSAAAEEYAKQTAVTLRTVSALTDVREEFKVLEATLYHTYVAEIGQIDVRTSDPNDKRNVRLGPDVRIRFASDTEWTSIPAFIDAISAQAAKADDPIDRADERDDQGELVSKRVFLTEAPMELALDGEVVELKRTRIPYTVITEKLTSRAVAARLYAEGKREIGREGDFEFEGKQGRYRTRIQILLNQDGTMRLHMEAGDGLLFTRVAVYGTPA